MTQSPRARISALSRMLCAALLTCSSASFAADTPTSPPAQNTLAQARQLIKTKQWGLALEELKRVNETGSADWNNLMGYTLRKGSPPDLAGAEKYYNDALRIDPKHRGALEYSGELYLIKGDLPTAEQRLATLDKVCTLPCEEYTDLKKSVERYKTNGNKYVAAP